MSDPTGARPPVPGRGPAEAGSSPPTPGPGGSPGRGHVALVGATATGKTALALALARRHDDLEVVTVDSMQVYRGMDIGTAKPTVAERAEVPHHLVDLVDPHESFTVADYQRAARRVLADLEARGRRGLLVGGTGLYLRSIVDDLEIPGRFPRIRAELETDPDTEQLHRRLAAVDPEAAARMEPTNRRRVVRALEVTLGSGRPFSSFGPGLDRYPPSPIVQLAVTMPRALIDLRIEARYLAQLEAGLLDECRRLLDADRPLSPTARQALGYKELFEHLEGRSGLPTALDLAARRTRRFARRQERWFRRDPRIRFVEVDDNPLAALDAIGRHWIAAAPSGAVRGPR